MSTGGAEFIFEPLQFRRMVLAGMGDSQYSVRSSSGESKEIKADTAYEAFRLSGLKDAVKIERLSNMGTNVVEKSKFVPDADAGGADREMTAHERLLKRTTPIVSADELDELIQAFRREAEKEAAAASGEEPVSIVPEPAPSPAPDIVSSPVGMDVHGDGFDEIIPSAPQMKIPSARPETAPAPAPQEAMRQPADAAPAPERELSPEEVEKLLSGKES